MTTPIPASPENLNARLAAVLERHPKLRPSLEYLGQLFYRENLWRYDTGTGPVYPLRDPTAHNAIGMAMLNALPKGHGVRSAWWLDDDRWYVFDDTQSDMIYRTFANTALEAMLAFWEAATPQEG